jgi:hypothetical protein
VNRLFRIVLIDHFLILELQILQFAPVIFFQEKIDIGQIDLVCQFIGRTYFALQRAKNIVILKCGFQFFHNAVVGKSFCPDIAILYITHACFPEISLPFFYPALEFIECDIDIRIIRSR